MGSVLMKFRVEDSQIDLILLQIPQPSNIWAQVPGRKKISEFGGSQT